MRRFLPVTGLIIAAFLIFSFSGSVSAQVATPTPLQVSPEGWVGPDPEVTFVGKTGARSGEFLDWKLRNYNWLCIKKTSDNICNNQNNPLVSFWILIRNIVYALLALFVLGTAFVLIITRGQSITIMRFIPRFVFVVLLITFSFSLIQFIYQINDIIQDFFLRVDGRFISTQDLLYIGFNYESFLGYRRVGPEFDESAFISLLLVKLTAITYYVMTGLLLIRKIILWFFLIISPVFPLLLFYRPIRNTAKIWVGEFFRWLLYAPLFAIFLHGLVVIWRAGIPLPFDFSGVEAGKIVYPLAVNILLGGPGQTIGIKNSVNLPDTFALYVVALLMLWVVILLPFLLLKIFLDYLSSFSFDQNIMIKQLLSRNFGFLSQPTAAPSPPPPPPSGFTQTGLARSLPFFTKKQVLTQPVEFKTNIQTSVRESTDILRLANLSIPKMRDIARFEASTLSRDITQKQEVSRFNHTLARIANPTSAVAGEEREKFSTIRGKLIAQKQKGNPIATSVLTASDVQVQVVKEGLPRIEAVKKATLPVLNRVQQVSLEDYEEVRKMWVENYQTVDVPKGLGATETTREEWIKQDVDKINQAITLLSSVEPEKVSQGMEMVANILPFLLIGGFSKSEVVSYLKAKLEAGKQVMSELVKKEEEEETKVSAKTKVEKPKEASISEKLEEPIKENPMFGDEDKNNL